MEAWEHIAPELPPGGEKAAGGWFIWGKWRGRQCFSGNTEAGALIAALEAAPE